MDEPDAGAGFACEGDAADGVPFVGRALGSEVRCFIRPACRADAIATSRAYAWRAVQAEFAAVDLALSRFRDDSELAALNRRAGSGGATDVSWRLREAVATMHRACRLTDGRFDPTVLDVLEAIGEHGASVAPPEAAAAAALAADTPVANLERPRRVRVPERPLDTGGIGKGLALRWAARRALAGIAPGSSLLLDAGGDIIAAGAREPWQVAIEDPVGAEGDDAPIAVVAVPNGAIATSSVRVRRWLAPDGRPVHHLIDPVTRAPARTGLLAVTVAGADPAWAEVWAKALFLAGWRAIGEEACRRGMAAWWVEADGRLGITPAARSRSTWVAEHRIA